MADNLIFPIGFDLQKAVEKAGQDWDKTYAKKLETYLAKRPIKVKLNFENLTDVKARLAQLKIDPITPETKASIKELARELQVLAKALEQVQKYSKNPAQLGQQNFRNDVQLEKLRQANERLEIQKRRVALAEQKHAEAMKRSASASKQLSSEYQTQEGYISRLVKRLAVYAAFSAVSGLLTNIRQVTAEFELQRVSLGAIIQDQQKANQLFAEIKSFALTSPLKILDLTKYTKQVAAYGFETEKLFNTTKMLADISVGLGVDMSRLTLFLGQVYATGYLRASEVRQATEAGIPLVDKLAKKLEELNGRAYTAAEVMDMISKRAISYELVEQVFKDMTSAGGEFYNMQIKQSQTLFGMWSKLGDAAAIMYDQIGNTSSINAGMKLAIRSIEQMMRNWKITARVLDSVAVAMAVYVVGLKNAAVASKALTTAEATRLAITNKQIIATPKLIASIFGQNAATRLSTTLTKAHTAAMIRQSAATNMLSKGFWKLTAAMLANPWVAVAAAVAGVVAAIIHFTGNAETAADRAEKLNNSVASLKNLEDTTKPLIDTYNELINKTERTAEEQKKLSEVTHELAKQYPGAITAIGDFGEEIDLAADKLNKLYQAEKKARMDNTRYELGLTEKKIEETENKIAALEKQLLNGKKWVGGGGTGGGGGGFVAMSDDDKGKILKQIDDLRYGEDGQGGLQALKETAQATRDTLEAMSKGITVDALHIERFGAWKKKLTEFNKEVGGIKVKLFDDSTIAQFGTLEEALDTAAKKYKDATESVEKYNKTLEQGVAKLGKDQFDRITAERDEAQAMKELSEEALNYYNAMALLLKVMGGGRSGQSDPRLSILREMASTLKQVNKEYDELAKKEGATKALADTQDKYANTFKYLQSLATKYKFELPDFGVPTDAASLIKYLDAVKEAMKKLPKSEKAVLSLETDIADINMADAQKKIEAKLKRLADRISRTKTAKEFYEKILGMTGDYSLASKVADSIFGQNGAALQKALADQVRGMTNGIELPDGIISADNIINYKALRQFAEANKDELGKMYDELIKISNDGQRDLAKTYDGYLKDLEKAKTYADKRVELARTTAAKIREIEQNPQYTKEQKAELKRGYQEREDREAAKLEYEAFKDTPLYVQMFEDLEHASTSTLEMMKSRLEGLSGVWGTALDPTQLKEMQSRMNEIDAQLRTRNPFKTLKESYQQYRDAVKSVSLQGAAENAGAAAKELYNRSEMYGADSAQARAAEKELKAREKIVEIARKVTAENKKGAKALDAAAQIANDNLKIARGHLELAAAEEQALRDKSTYKDPNQDPAVIAAHEKVEAAKEEVNLAERVAEITTNNANTAKRLKKNFASAANQVTQYMSMAGDLAHAVADTMEALGGDEDDVQFWNDIGDAIGDLTAGFQGIIDSILSLNVAGIISNAIGVIPNMVKGFVGLFSAGKVRKANKEIKQQQKLLDQLEYTYGRLEKAAERAFAGDYLSNYRQQIKNLQAQQTAYLRMAEAERSKGKDEDAAKTEEYLNQARDIADKIADMQNDLAAQIAGSDIASMARDFVQAWWDAYKEFGNTTDAMGKKFKEMIDQMVANSVIAQVMKRALEPTFKMINEMKEWDFYSTDFWERLSAEAQKGAENGAHGAEVVAGILQKAGISLREAGSDYTGIAKNIAGATSEEINTAAAIGNTLMYYVSPIPRIDENLARVVAIMKGGSGTPLPASGASGAADYTAMFLTANEHLSSLPRMEQHLSEIHRMLGRVIATNGSRTGINAFIR